MLSGCEMVGCPDYKGGKCHSELDYVNRESGEDMCHRNPDAVPRIQFEEEYEINQFRAEVDRLRAEAVGMREALEQAQKREACFQSILMDMLNTLAETGGQLCPASITLLRIQSDCHKDGCVPCWEGVKNIAFAEMQIETKQALAGKEGGE